MAPRLQTSSAVQMEPGVAASERNVLFPQQLPSAQHLLLPRRLPRLESFELAGSCQTSQPVGGDFYDVISAAHGKTWLIIADVMGKGVHAALLAATVRGLVRMLVRMSGGPSALLQQLNDALYDELSPNGVFVTVQAALVDTTGNRLVLANAGHCPALVARQNRPCLCLAPEGIPIGIFPETSFSEETIHLSNVQSLLLHTDGLSDALSPSRERFGLERLKRWLSSYSVLPCPASEMSETLSSVVAEFQGGSPPPDDQTFLLLTRSRVLG